MNIGAEVVVVEFTRHALGYTVAEPGGGGARTCPDPENLCKVCVTETDHPPPPLEC